MKSATSFESPPSCPAELSSGQLQDYWSKGYIAFENGSMHFLPGAHRDGPLKHEHTTDCEIVKDRYSPEEAVSINLNAGGIVFFHGNAPHFTPPNRSANRRRALQYHYRSTANSLISKEAFNQVFKEADGTPASCAAAVPPNF